MLNGAIAIISDDASARENEIWRSKGVCLIVEGCLPGEANGTQGKQRGQTIVAYQQQQVPSPDSRDNYQREMAAKCIAADNAARDKYEIAIRISRREYLDLLEAYKFLRQINPWMKNIGIRLEKMAVRVRDGLDKVNPGP